LIYNLDKDYQFYFESISKQSNTSVEWNFASQTRKVFTSLFKSFPVIFGGFYLIMGIGLIIFVASIGVMLLVLLLFCCCYACGTIIERDKSSKNKKLAILFFIT
jgi:hypothetical protein